MTNSASRQKCDRPSLIVVPRAPAVAASYLFVFRFVSFRFVSLFQHRERHKRIIQEGKGAEEGIATA